MTNVPHEKLRAFAERIFTAAGCHEGEAKTVADHLVDANLLGHDSHGVIRIPIYCDWLQAGKVRANCRAERVIDNGPILVIDGGFGFGQAIGRAAMETAIERTAATGLVLVAIRNCGHLGRIGAYAEQLARAGLVSLHFVNSSGGGIMVAPHGGSERRFSANPIAAGAPGPGGDPIVLDFSTSSIAEGNIMLAIARGEPLEPGLILDADGMPSTDPADFYGPPPGAILPFGDQKGSGLSLFCEILAGSLTGGQSGHPGNTTANRFVNNMLSIVIQPAALACGSAYSEDVGRLVDWIKSARPAAADRPVLLPGEKGARIRAERLERGIPLDRVTAGKLDAAARELGLAETLSGICDA
jgi:uncharacterized oxidoreductase